MPYPGIKGSSLGEHLKGNKKSVCNQTDFLLDHTKGKVDPFSNRPSGFRDLM